MPLWGHRLERLLFAGFQAFPKHPISISGGGLHLSLGCCGSSVESEQGPLGKALATFAQKPEPPPELVHSLPGAWISHPHPPCQASLATRDAEVLPASWGFCGSRKEYSDGQMLTLVWPLKAGGYQLGTTRSGGQKISHCTLGCKSVG